LVLCSRNARPEKGLVRRPHVDQHGCPSQREGLASLEGTYLSLDARSGRPNRPPSCEGEVGDNKKRGMRSGQVPFLLAEQRKGWKLMIFRARATRGRGLPSLGLMARLGVLVRGRVRKPRAVGGQTDHPPVKRRLRARLGWFTRGAQNWFFWFICFVSFNQTNESNQTNQIDGASSPSGGRGDGGGRVRDRMGRG